MSKINTEDIEATLIEKMGDPTNVVIGGIFRPGLATRIINKVRGRVITAFMVITLLGTSCPKAIAESHDLEQQIEYIEATGAYQQADTMKDLLIQIRDLVRQDKKNWKAEDWKLLDDKIDQFGLLAEKLHDEQSIIKKLEMKRFVKLFKSDWYVDQGSFTEAFKELDEYMNEAEKERKKDWIADGADIIRLIKIKIGKEQETVKGQNPIKTLSVIASNGGIIQFWSSKSYISIDTVNTFFAVQMKYTSSLSEPITKTLVESEITQYLRDMYALRKNVSEKDIIIEFTNDGYMYTVTAKTLVDLN